jgi:DNA uptake protein ComE-like DNA-binding protein
MTRIPLSFCIPVVAFVAMVSASSLDAQVGRKVTIIDANLATEEELRAVPHLTPTLVSQLVSRRPFATTTDLNKLLSASLSKEQLAQVYERIFVPLNLNTASKEEILLIPRMGNRMLHEFEEYRPYKALAQFHREIGKYVDDKELARLEQYVFVPINLNTATDEDILSIPGVGKRMLHEFKEYRPYKSIEQFRREIGKYVDDKEVARLERYVTIGTP